MNLGMEMERTHGVEISPALVPAGSTTASSQSHTSNVEHGLYSPLVGDDEIRLLTIEPLHPDGIVHCSLVKVSLTDYTENYSSFLAKPNRKAKTQRDIMEEWKDPKRLSLERSGSANCEPVPNTYRFKWGDFAALSYVWGDGKHKQKILVNGQKILVTKNLGKILRHLASTKEFTGAYKIWIDALCINQNDEAERASQVLKMREIYSGTWTVISWLGESEENPHIPNAFEFLEILASLTESQKDLSQLFSQRKDLLEKNYFSHLHQLIRNPYWTRLWIVQEVVMGASSTLLRCGSHALRWPTFYTGLAVLYNGTNWDFKDQRLITESLSPPSIPNTPQGMSDNLKFDLLHKDLRQLSQYEECSGSRLGLRRLLEVANSMECQEKRDKVFALTGMMDTPIANTVIQAYSLSIPELFTSVAEAFIQHHGNLEPLRQANPWGPSGAPSWAPDWTWTGRMRFSRPEITLTGPLWDALDTDLSPETLYNAHKNTAAKYSFLKNNNRSLLLQCEGLIFDSIAGLGARELNYWNWDPDSISPPPHNWSPCYTNADGIMSEAETTQALYKTLLLDRLNKGERVQNRHSAILSLPSTFKAGHPQFEARGWKWLASRGKYYPKWERWREVHDQFKLGSKKLLGAFFTDVTRDDVGEATYGEVLRRAERTFMERRFMVTKKGRFGWAPDNVADGAGGEQQQARVGDLIAIVFGCSTPLVIRECGDFFQVVGEAYVQGVMDGEAVDFPENKKRIFTFC